MASNSNDSIPSWDEFGNDEELDYDEIVEEPTENQDYGPSLPPGFVQDDSNDIPLAPLPRHNNFPSLPIEQDDPEDPITTNGSTIVLSQRSGSDELPTRVCGPEEPMPSRSVARQVIGPSLPPEFLPTNDSQNQMKEKPAVIGPSLPVDFLDPNTSNDHVDEPSCSFDTRRRQSKPDSLIGPSFDPGLIGPSLPKPNGQSSADPQLPFDEGEPGNSSDFEPRSNGEVDEDDDIVGPMPPANKDQEELEYLYRLHEFESKQAAKPQNKREKWMTEPPKKMASYGLDVPRSFAKTSSSSSADGRNLWTSTPNDNNTQPNTSASSSRPVKDTIRDLKEEQRASALNADRKESLLDSHRKRKMDGGPSSSSANGNERRPFNREVDMEVRGLSGKMNADEVKQRMGDLSSRFGHGTTSNKFL
uniref:DUF3752 domain-containing protein n=1 Tax=Acrobeloides nanus TaxID=290746 RepID=A0A914C7S0_9BILA